jgi:GMP synthase-like glutamine amidotransferase
MFLIVDNGRGAQSESASPLIDCLRDLRLDHQILKADAIIDPKDFEQFIGFILSDAELAPREEVSLSRFRLNFQVLLNTDVPILGIGTGARIIAEAYGAVIDHRDPLEGQSDTVKVSNHSVLFDFLPETISLGGGRPCHITQVPECFEVTATSDRCPVHAAEHRSKELYAMNFSVASAGEAGPKIIKNFLRYTGTSAGAL